MEIKTEVVDNFLKIEELNMLKEMMVFSDFPYQFTKTVAGKEETQIPHWYWYGTHIFYKNGTIVHKFFSYYLNNIFSYIS